MSAAGPPALNDEGTRPVGGAAARSAGRGEHASRTRNQTLLWLAQRASAAVLAVCVVAHLGTMIVAVRGGLTAAEILGRTRGSLAWAAFYTVFVVGVAIHAPIGLRTVVAEWRGAHARGIDLAVLAFGALLLVLGLRAVFAVTTGGPA